MKGILKITLLITVLAVYLFSTAGVGRYSCHCEHSSQITLFGISSECTCTHTEQFKDPGHSCPCCGEHLITQSIRKDDCCSLKFYFLDTDQNNSADDQIVFSSYAQSDLQISPLQSQTPFPVQARIKTFQSVFRVFRPELYNLNRQLLI